MLDPAVTPVTPFFANYGNGNRSTRENNNNQQLNDRKTFLLGFLRHSLTSSFLLLRTPHNSHNSIRARFHIKQAGNRLQQQRPRLSTYVRRNKPQQGKRPKTNAKTRYENELSTSLTPALPKL